MAVGYIGAAGGSALVEQWNGSTWTATTITGAVQQQHSGVRRVLHDALVLHVRRRHHSRRLHQHRRRSPNFWNGSTWTGTYPPPILTTTDYHLYGVSCAGTKFCTAVGDTQTGAQPPRMYGQTWNGDESGSLTAWTVVTGLPAVSGGASLDSISCFSATSCTAAGADPELVGRHVERRVLDAAVHPDRPLDLQPECPLRRGLPDRLGLCGGG